MSIRDQVAIVAVGSTAQGELPGRDATDIAVDAVELALREAGVDKSAVDGLVTCRVGNTTAGVDTQVGERLGINPRYSATLDYGTCNFSLHLGVMAITAGLASTVVLCYGANQRSAGVNFNVPFGGGDLAAASGYLHVSGPAAMALQRHMELYGTTEEQFGWIAVGQREWAQRNPLAIFRDPMSIDDYLAMPYLTQPLRRPDVTMISDGGAAIVLTSTPRVADFPRPGVLVRGVAQRTALRRDQNPDCIWRPWLADVAADVYTAAALGADDVDLLYVQDPTAVWVLQVLEAFGFCKQGEAGPFLAAGHTRIGGSLPVNTNGGQLSESYMWGWLHLCEAVRQLRGDCGERQVAGAEVALYCSTMALAKGAATMLTVAR
jgi:acetyl-CoA acetyltransferase